MIRVLYFYRGSSVLNPFLERQIEESSIKEQVTSFESIMQEEDPEMTEFYKCIQWHEMIFENGDGVLLNRLVGPFSAEDLNVALEASLLANEPGF